MNHEDASELIALGAVGALTGDEYRVLEQLIAADPALAAEYADLLEIVSVLAEESMETPPPSLRASVLDAIGDVEQLVPVVTLPVEHQPVEPRSVVTLPVEPPPARQSLGDAHRPATPVVPIHRRWMIPATAAAAVVILLVAGLIINRSADAPGGDRMSAVLNDDSANTITLTGSLSGLRLVASEDQDAAVLIGSDIAQPDPGTVFQLWAIRNDETVGISTFTPAATGEVAMLIENADTQSEFAVTEEPVGGSDQPTSDPIAASPGA